MLSLDWYGQGAEFNEAVDKALTFTTQLAQEKHKLYALSECGPLSVDLQKILEKYQTSYILTWRNAPSRRPMPTLVELEKIPGFNRAAYDEFMKQPKPEELLKAMRENPHYLFLQEIQ
jgi:mannan endo-1,4-beta-mannosidase